MPSISRVDPCDVELLGQLRCRDTEPLPQRVVGSQSDQRPCQRLWLLRGHDNRVRAVGEPRRNLADRCDKQRHTGAGRLHQRDGEAFLTGGQYEDVGGRQEAHDVGTLAEEHEPVAQSEFTVLYDEIIAERASPDRHEPDRDTPVEHRAGSAEKNVVALFRAEVRDRQRQKLALGSPNSACTLSRS